MRSVNRWDTARLVIDARKGIDALEKLTGERPGIWFTSDEAKSLLSAADDIHDAFFAMPIQDRLKEAGL